MNTNIYRTWDEALRQKRYDQLMIAAEAAVKAARRTGYDVLVTGSLSRGQVHPWSDLDLLVVPNGGQTKPRSNVNYKIYDGAQAYAPGTVDVVFSEDVVPQLAKGLIGSACKLEDVPPLGDLPNPELALLRSAFTLDFTVKHIRHRLKRVGNISQDTDTEHAKWLQLMAFETYQGWLHDKAVIGLKRIAVFQDGGQSDFLDGSWSKISLQAFLERLARAVDEPVARPAVLLPEAVESLIWLFDEPYNEPEVVPRVLKALDHFDAWATHLRGLTDLEETHGIVDEPAGMAP